MSRKKYLVWVDIEECTCDENDEVVDSKMLDSQPWASCASFEDEGKAIGFAKALNDIATGEVFHRDA